MNLNKTFLSLFSFLFIFSFISCDNSSTDSEWQEISATNFELSAGTYDFTISGSNSQKFSDYDFSFSANINFEGYFEIDGTEDDSKVKTTLTKGEVKAIYKLSSAYYNTFKETFTEELKDAYEESGFSLSWNDKNHTATLSHSYTEEELETTSTSTTYSEFLNEIQNENAKIYISEENPNKFKIQYVQTSDVENLGQNIHVPITIIVTKRE